MCAGTKKISPCDLSYNLKSELVAVLGTRLDESNLYRYKIMISEFC